MSFSNNIQKILEDLHNMDQIIPTNNKNKLDESFLNQLHDYVVETEDASEKLEIRLTTAEDDISEILERLDIMEKRVIYNTFQKVEKTDKK